MGEDPNRQAVHGDGGVYVAAGDVVAGKYRIEHVLGVGGMAFVMSAKHVELGERFALKFLNPQFLGNLVIIERFTREARAACKIRSEHVARVFDVGTHEGAPFLVMEHLDGRDLATVLSEEGALRVEQAVEYTMQACEALSVAHSLGVVHRDVKPENLFLVEHGGLPTIKLLDFGISKIALTGGDSPSRLTGQLTLGTPCYMSPEQIRSTASADARSDVWSLGVVLYELLTGAEAFQASSITEMCAAVLELEPRPLRELRPEVPEELEHVVARCMQKDPAKRFANVAELAVALLPFAPTRALVSAERSSSRLRAATPIAAVFPTPYRVGEAIMSEAPISVRASVEPPAPPPPARRGWASVLVATAVFAIAAAAVRVVPRGDAGDGGSTSTEAASPPAEEKAVVPVIGARAEPREESSVITSPAIQKRAPAPPPATARPAPIVPHATASASADAGAHPVAAKASVAPPAPTAVELGY
jgi:serine/threonine-protein kinase